MTGATPTPDAAGWQCLTFLLDGQEFAIDLLRVREIVPYEGATRVPRVQPCVLGVVNLRGNVVPVIDLAVGLGMPATEVTPRTCLMIIEAAVGGENSVLGLVAAAVNHVLDLRADDVEPPPSFGTRVPAAFLVGIARSEGGFVSVLDLDRILAEGILLHGTPGSGRERTPAPSPPLRETP